MPTDKKGDLTLIVGENGTGKSHLLLNLIDKNKTLLYNKTGEYNFGFIGSSEDFIQLAFETPNKVLAFEEAQIYFTHKNLDERLSEILNMKRHRNNSIIALFLRLRMIPLYMLDAARYLFLFHTSDTPSYLAAESKFKDHPQLLQYHKSVNANSDWHYFICLERIRGQWVRIM